MSTIELPVGQRIPKPRQLTPPVAKDAWLNWRDSVFFVAAVMKMPRITRPCRIRTTVRWPRNGNPVKPEFEARWNKAVWDALTYAKDGREPLVHPDAIRSNTSQCVLVPGAETGTTITIEEIEEVA